MSISVNQGLELSGEKDKNENSNQTKSLKKKRTMCICVCVSILYLFCVCISIYLERYLFNIHVIVTNNIIYQNVVLNPPSYVWQQPPCLHLCRELIIPITPCRGRSPVWWGEVLINAKGRGGGKNLKRSGWGYLINMPHLHSKTLAKIGDV